MTLPGTFPPHSDSWLLARVLRETLRRRGRAAVLDVGTGSGVLATTAALCGAQVTAVDRSLRAVCSATLTAWANRVRVQAVRGDLVSPLNGSTFDVIVSNPPYVPAADAELPTSGPRCATDAGLDGRAVIDRLCAAAPAFLRPGGELLLVHSEVCDEDATLGAMRDAGLDAEVVARERGPLGPLLRERRELLVQRGLLAPQADEEQVLVLRGRCG
ncbi:MAG TPA: HemK2/MTQ2 family protein methyltransferase [Solirubrobacteraceae bacterium]